MWVTVYRQDWVFFGFLFHFYFVPGAFVNCHVCHVSASPLPKRSVSERNLV
jgi:hypothetical protein